MSKTFSFEFLKFTLSLINTFREIQNIRLINIILKIAELR